MEKDTTYHLQLTGARNGYQLDNEELMADLSDEAKARFTDDEKKVLVLLEEDSVEPWESSFRDGERYIYRFITRDAAAAKKYGFEPEVPVYCYNFGTGYTWFYQEEFEKVEKPADLLPILEGIAADIEMAKTLCTTPGITLDDAVYDKRDGYMFCFSTTDAALAEKLGFEMLE
jgi:hypothetical protein